MGRNSMSRDDLMSSRVINKTLPTKARGANYRGEDLESIYKRMIKNGIVLPCPGCGTPMEPFRDRGVGGQWRCHGISCPNNPDDTLHGMECHDIDTKVVYNHNRVFNNGWQPNCIC